MAGGDPSSRGTANPGTGSPGTGNRGTEDPGTANRGIEHRGTERRGTERRGTENRGTGRRSMAAARPATLAAQPSVAFADTIVGARPTPTAEVFVFNLVPTYEAFIDVRLEGDADFTIERAPARLRPAAEGQPQPIVIAFRPTARTRAQARLIVRASWQMNAAPATELSIALEGLAHVDGEPTHQAAAELDRQAAAAAQDAQREAVVRATLDEAIAREEKIARPYPHKGQETALRHVYDDALRALDAIGDRQRTAINTARGEALVFKRKVAAKHASAGLELALRALNLTAIGLAASLAGELKRVLKPGNSARGKILVAPDAALDFLAEEAKTLFKDNAKDYLGGLAAKDRSKPPDHKEEAVYLFAQQDELLTAIKNGRREALTRTYYGLMPGLRRDGAGTIRALTAFAEGLAALSDAAYATQLFQSRLAWMSAMSQSVLGAVALPRAKVRAPGEVGTVTDIRGANAFPPEGGQVETIDGVIDVEFVAEFTAATTPIRVVAVRSAGIATDILRDMVAFNHDRLRGMPLVIRATGRAEGLAQFRVSVSRDEAGRLEHLDRTSADGSPGTWLSRHAGMWGTAAQGTGAKRLTEAVLDAAVARNIISSDEAT